MDIRRKNILTLFLGLLVLLSLISVVSAHPGKTDSDGGHVDHSTGEYHYHHGYPAHSHYDIDGDFIIDCPYDFTDLTDHSRGDSSSDYKSSFGYNSQSSSSLYNYASKETVAESSNKVITKEVPYFPIWAKWVVIISAFVTICLIFANHSKNQQIAEMNHDARNSIDEFSKKEKQIRLESQAALSKIKHDAALLISEKDKEIEKLNGRITKLQTELNSVISTLPVGSIYFPSVGKPKQQLYHIEIPSDIYYINGTVPVRGFISDRTPYGDFTVYVAQKGRCYHTDPYCGNGFLYARHAYDTINKLPPCRICGYRSSASASIPDWYFQLKGLPLDPKTAKARIHKSEYEFEQLNIDSFSQT